VCVGVYKVLKISSLERKPCESEKVTVTTGCSERFLLEYGVREMQWINKCLANSVFYALTRKLSLGMLFDLPIFSVIM
jgi:hypothetical protein